MVARKETKRKVVEPSNSIRVGSVRTFLDALEEIECSDEEILYYRGHSNFSYTLRPSIYRENNWIQNEDILFKEIILKCPDDFRGQENTFQTLVKMQHYSLPTRLLDLTTNPLIGLYFACSEGKSDTEGGEVVVLKIPKREVRYYDSDAVSVVSNISRRPSSFKVSNISDVKKFNKTDEMKYLLHEVKKEKPYFEPEIKKEHIESVICVKPKLDNPRIIRQDGAFLLFGVRKGKSTPATIKSEYMYSKKRIIVNHLSKNKILEQLRTLGITKGTIFPEIDRVAEHLKDIYGNVGNERPIKKTKRIKGKNY